MEVTPAGSQGHTVPLTSVPLNNPSWLVSNRELIRSVQSIDAGALFGEGHELAFALDPDTKRPVVRVVDQKTQEVLWQAPPEYVLRVAAVFGKQEQLAGSAKDEPAPQP